MRNLTPELQEKFNRLAVIHETMRQMIIEEEGQLDPFKNYPELDAVADQMFRILSDGKDFITIDAETIVRMSEN